MDSDALGVSPQDRDLMIRTVIGEAGNQPDVGKVAVAHTILNRVAAGGYGDSPSAVVLAKGQFEPWATRSGELMSYSPNSPAYQGAARAVDMALSGQAPDPTGGAVNFYSPSSQAAFGRAAPSWASGQGTQIGAHVFYGGSGGQQQQQGSAPTMAQAQSDPNDISDADIEALMMGRNARGGAPASPPAQPTSAPAASVSPTPSTPSATASQPGDISDDEIASLLTGKGPSSATATSASPGAQPGDVTPAGVRPLTIQPKGSASSPYGTLDGVTIGQQSQSASSPYAAQGDTGMAVGRGIVEGVPIVGPALVSGIDHAAALERSVRENIPYSQALAQVQGFDQATVAAHPTATTAGNIAGGVASMGGLGATALGARALGITGNNLLMQAATGGATNALIGGADAGVRSGGDPASAGVGAAIGAGAGAAGPLVGKGVEMAGNALGGYLQGFAPQGAATNRLLGAIQSTGGDLPTMAQRLADNPRLSLMDVNPGVQDLAQGLAAQSGPARDTLVQAYGQRAGSAKDAVTGSYADLAASPDVKAVLDGIRARANADAALAPASMREAFDASMGDAKNPKAVLNQIIEQRSQQSAPLYQEALSKPVVWDNRLQQFLDDPVVQQGLAKGARIQRLESLASGEPFNPTDYAIKDFDAAGDPIIGTTPNMRTLNVVKKGLDAMVEDSKDSVTGRLSEEGRAIDQVRKAFVSKLDQTNPTYAEARAAWQGPTLAHQAFQKGLGVFCNRGGMAGVDTTPGALADWMGNASPTEQDAIKVGARAAAERAMAASNDPSQAAAKLVGNSANQAKLTAILGPDEASSLVNRLNYQYGDPIGDAFAKGADVFRNRAGSAGLEDRPEFLKSWLDNASDPEKQALQQGVMASLQQQLGGVRNAALKGETIPQVDFNRQKLALVFGQDKADQLAQRMADEQDIAKTNAKLFQGSQTQPRQANKLATAVRGVGPLSMEVGLPSFAFMNGNPDTGLALGGLALGRRALQYAGQRADIARNATMADMLSATGPARDAAVNRLLNAATVANDPGLAQGLSTAANAGVIGSGNALGAYMQPQSLRRPLPPTGR